MRDTTSNSLLASKMYMTGILSDFAYTYFLDHKSTLLAYKTSKDFGQSFKLDENDWTAFRNMAQKDSIEIKFASEPAKRNIELKLKASIARQLWRSEGFFEVLNITDNTVNKALEILKK